MAVRCLWSDPSDTLGYHRSISNANNNSSDDPAGLSFAGLPFDFGHPSVWCDSALPNTTDVEGNTFVNWEYGRERPSKPRDESIGVSAETDHNNSTLREDRVATN